jgi:hypothetical protein
MPDENSQDNYWKTESIKHERRYRRVRDEKQALEERLSKIFGVASVEDAISQAAELVKVASTEWKQTREELESLREQVKTPDEWKTKAEEVQKALATRDRRDEWSQHVKDQLADGVPIEDIWAKAGYEPGDEPTTPEQINELVGKARDAAGYLFKPPASAGGAPSGAQTQANGTPKRPVSGLGGGQGTPDRAALRMSYRRSDVAPGTNWQKSKPELVQAIRDGTAELVDG